MAATFDIKVFEPQVTITDPEAHVVVSIFDCLDIYPDANCAARMREVDRLNDAERALANEFGVNAVQNVRAGMTRLPSGEHDMDELRRRLEEARRNKPLWRWGGR